MEVKTLFEARENNLRPLNMNESEAWVTAVMLEKKEDKFQTAAELLESLEAKPLPTALRMMLNRINLYAPEIPLSVPVLFCLCSTAKTPGHITLWTYAVIKETRKLGGPITTERLMKELLPDGIPTDEYLDKAWDAQKGPSLGLQVDNYFDQKEAY
jgi:hypothetical protein